MRLFAVSGFLLATASLFLSLTLSANAETCPQILRTLQLDDRGSDVAALQTFLQNHGFLSSIDQSGYFDTATQTAVQKYQAGLGIVSSGSPSTTKWGIVGPTTLAALSTCKLPVAKKVVTPVYRYTGGVQAPVTSTSETS